jgi:hypothetical protein
MGQMGRDWRKNSSSTFVLTALISFGLFNVLRTGNFFADFPYLVCSLTVSFRCSSLQHLRLVALSSLSSG